MNYETFLELIESRRSIRSFKSDPIPDEFVTKIIEAARWAPSAANSQPWEFIIVTNAEIKNEIINLLNYYRECSRKVELTREDDLRFSTVANPVGDPGYKNAPVFIILCGDPRTIDAYPLLHGVSNGDSHFISSLASAFLYMTLAATTLGLGSQWVSATAHPFVQCLMKETLGIPKNLVIYDMMAVGYPAHEPKARLMREFVDLVHYERYDREKCRTDEKIRSFIVDLRKWLER